MASNGKYIHKLDSNASATVFTNAYTLGKQKNLVVPTEPGLDGITGRVSVIRLDGTVHDPAAKTVYVIVTYDQAGTHVWLEERSVDITHAPFGTGWGAVITYESLVRLLPSECPEGTISIFVKTDNATATCNEARFLWEE